MITFESAEAKIDEIVCGPGPRTESRETTEAHGAILAAPAVSVLALPPFDRALMDGYAIGEPALSGPFLVTGLVAAGQQAGKPLRAGTTVKVMTGAPIPPGTEKVIRVERSRLSGDRVIFTADEDTPNIALQGQHVSQGQEILAVGSRLGAAEIGSLIACGVVRVEVFRPLRAAVFSTGDELVQRGTPRKETEIPDSNGPMLAALGREYGLDLVQQGCLPDDREALSGAFQDALTRCDLLVVSGGMSAGDFDFVPEVFGSLGFSLHFTRVAVKPGKPTLFGSWRAPDGQLRLAFGLPGNPVGAYLMFQLLVLRAVHRWRRSGCPLPLVTLPLACPYSRRDTERLELVPCRLTPEATLAPVPYHGSGHLLGLLPAIACFLVPPGVDRLESGARVTVRFLPRGGFG